MLFFDPFELLQIQYMKKMIRCLVFVSLLIHSTLAQKHPHGLPKIPPKTLDTKWKTLTGQEPLVISRGGFSGLFPESSQFANSMALQLGLSNGVLFCNLQLTKDGVGICLSDIRLDNSTTIALNFPKGQKTYKVNGKDIKGWFASDYIADDLFQKVSLTQNIFSRSSMFDSQLPISTVDDVAGVKPPQLWLNVQYDAFYNERKLSVTAYIQDSLKLFGINYLSSPEIGFLKSINGRINKARTKLIFQLLGENEVEPTTNKTYGSIAKDLAPIKAFAAGILVPKEYIYPVGKDRFLGAPSTLVADAHKQGLEVYASGFANDFLLSYNYSYEPSAEYLQFVDNGQFAIDGVLTDFPPTAAAAIACFANNKNGTRNGGALVITNNGASGIYPGCTDLAYQQAVDDGADIIDCSVQLSKDGVAFCLDTVDLMGKSSVVPTFMSRTSTVTEIQPNPGIFSFDLSWSEIQSLKPQLVNPFISSGGFERNPANKNKGKFVTLNEFLEFAKSKAVTGVSIKIENAAYLASKKGLDIVGMVTKALSNATFDKQQTQKVLIQSDDTSVLSKFKDVPTYKRVLNINETIGDAPKPTVDEIKKYADAVTIGRGSIIKISNSFTTGLSSVVTEMKAANISVYVYVLRNEYITLAFDFFSDPMVEIATYIQGVGVDGIITEYPGTANRYLRSPCTNTDPKAKVPYTILPAEAGSLLGAAAPEAQPPAVAPNPPLKESDVVDPPLPPVAPVASSDSSTPAAGASAPGSPPPSSAFTNIANISLSLVSIIVLGLLTM